MMDADADHDGLIWHVDGRVSCMEGGARARNSCSVLLSGTRCDGRIIRGC
jgi:hypothetical protein